MIPILRPSFNVVFLFLLVRYFIALPMFIDLDDSYSIFVVLIQQLGILLNQFGFPLTYGGFHC
jgi:hypothetical protein